MKTRKILVITGMLTAITIGIILWIRSRTGFTKKVVRIAKQELEKWRNVTELSAAASQNLLKYWLSVGKVFTSSDMQNSNVQSRWPWSSAFISYLFYKAGAKGQFPYSASHTTYFHYARANRDNPRASLRGFKIDEYKPKIGDLVVFSREAGKGYYTNGFFLSHGELVVEVGRGYIKTIGGNVSNTVKESRFTTDSRGYLTKNEKDFFMVIQNNIK